VGIFFGIVTALSIVIALAIMIIRRRSSSSSSLSSSAEEEEEKERKEFKTAVIVQDKVVVESIKVSNNPMTLVVETVSLSTKATAADGVVNEHNQNAKVESTENSSAIKTTSISADWVQHEDTTSGEVWFENVESGETVWELPSID
jgi:hypothetical protein